MTEPIKNEFDQYLPKSAKVDQYNFRITSSSALTEKLLTILLDFALALPILLVHWFVQR
jgi:hypothetical protein